MSRGHRGWISRGREEEDYTRKVPDRVLIARLAKYLFKYRRRFIIAIVAILVVALATLLPPYLLMIAIDNYITVGDSTGLAFLSIILVSVYLVNWFSDYQRT
jgi:ATP-binding cassette subfamily B protein